MQTEIVSPDGARLATRVRGEGPPVVLVHGASSTSADWSGVARLLADAHRVVAYDRRGRAGSTDGPSYSFAREVEDLHAVLAWVGEPAHVVGHSFGARVALAAAPDADLRTLTLYEAPVAPDLVPAEVFARARAAHESGDWEGVLQAFQPAAGMTQDEIDFCVALPQVRESQRDAARRLQRELDALPSRLEPPAPLDVPVLYLVGGLTDSPVYLEGLDEVVAALRADRVELPGQRHIGMAGDPQGFAAALRPHLARG